MFYGHLYYGLGWQSSYRSFIILYFKVENLIRLYLIHNLCFSLFALLAIYVVSKIFGFDTGLPLAGQLIIFVLFPNLLFLFVFPLLTTHIDLFTEGNKVIIHKFYAPFIAFAALIAPLGLQYVWQNLPYGEWLVSLFVSGSGALVYLKFSFIVTIWQDRLVKIKLD